MEAITAANNQDDLDLAERHRYGDQQAFEEIYARFSKMIYNLAFRMAGSVDGAEDLTQEVFLRIFRHLGRFSGRSTLKTWVYRVTVNHCRSRLGRRRYFTQPLAEENHEGGVELRDSGRSPEDLALAQDTGRQIHRALGGLKPVFREAVVLRDLEGLSYEEIAGILKVRLGTVRSRIARGREQLRVEMERSR